MQRPTLNLKEIENLLAAAAATADSQQRKRIKEQLCAAVRSERRRESMEWLWKAWRRGGSPLDVPEVALLFAAVIAGEAKEE